MRIGIIGMGDMGQLYARVFSRAGYSVYACDLPENIETLNSIFKDDLEVAIFNEIEPVAAQSDFIIFSVETSKIDQVVYEAAKFIKPGQIVAGQTSVKTPEINAFKKYLDTNVNIATLHSLHGPHVDPAGQTLVLIPERISEKDFEEVKTMFECFGSKIEILESGAAHDQMMADIQVVTHIGFESIGTSFMHMGVFPWENPLLNSGLDNLKLLLTLRIYSYKHHVYAGMAMQNPFSKSDVRAYAMAENDIFGCMISGEKDELKDLIYQARDLVFKDFNGSLMLNDDLMKEFSLNPPKEHKPNSHLSLMAMVLTWARLGTNPYHNLICQTPPFKLRVGMAEYLFLNKELLDESIEAAVNDLTIRKDDLAFHTAVQEWAHIVESGNEKGYNDHFMKTKEFLKDRLEEGRKLSSMLIERIKDVES
ncbi:NAD(P)-binding domain-containing protein [Jiulongibacter sp. NS-SX5]|uniref:NAD(P)-binding domain-containing protein n=1 Tax=Jiulongibacter sp. NS-SX5 TaxID=3463854 RepID=UPI00405969C3